jgi:hypothetical protein
MAKFTITKWRCDRCGVVHDQRPPRPGGSVRYNVKVTADYEVAGGVEIDWSEMCNDCNAFVAGLVSSMRQTCKENPNVG